MYDNGKLPRFANSTCLLSAAASASGRACLKNRKVKSPVSPVFQLLICDILQIVVFLSSENAVGLLALLEIIAIKGFFQDEVQKSRCLINSTLTFPIEEQT